jgi:hypothetical protein
MSNRNFGGFITTGTVSANSTYASGVWSLSQYLYQKSNGSWPGSQYYSLFSGNATSVNESSNTTFYANTINIPNNTTAYWTIEHITTSANDFVETSNSFVISNNTGSFIVRTVGDLTTEGSESFQIAIRQDSNVGQILATSSIITLNDTSLSPLPSISFLLVGAGGNSFGNSNGNYSGGAGGAGAFEATGFTGYVTSNTYTVQIAAAGGSSTVLSGTFDILGNTDMYGTGGGYGAYKTNAGTTFAGYNGGGGAVWPTYNGSRWNMDSSRQAGGSSGQSSVQSTYSSQYPGVFKNYGGNGVNGQYYSIEGSSNLGSWAWAHGGGGGASGVAANTTVNLGTIIAYVDGGPGMSSNISGTLSYYGGGGGGYGYGATGGIEKFGVGGLGGGANTAVYNSTQNNGAPNTGGGSAGSGLGGSGVAYFRFPDSQISANTTGGATSYLSGTDCVVYFYSSGTIRFSRK